VLDEVGLFTYTMLEQVCDKHLKTSNFIRQVKRLA